MSASGENEDLTWVGPSMVLVHHDSEVRLSARTLTSLVSYALAGPSNEASTARRDEAVDEAHAAMVVAYAEHFGRTEAQR